MPTYTITLTQDEADTLEKLIPDTQEWLENALQGKLHSALHMLTLEHTEFNPAKLSHEDKIAKLKALNLKSRKERDAEELEKMKARAEGKDKTE